MLFNSLEFLLFFFPVTFFGYYILPRSCHNYWLLICSLFFYAWGEPTFVLVMIGSIIFNYVFALFIDKQKNCRTLKRLLLVLALTTNFSIIGLYKYMNFISYNLRLIPRLQMLIPQTEYVLPIGISFFTFQAVSYVIDVYRGIPAQKNPAYLALYISFFPQLIAGPIVRYTTIMDQINMERTITIDSMAYGILRFLYGFNKKMLLANTMAEIADAAFAIDSLSMGMAWLGAIAYSLQIYFDFSGYSDMAIGLGKMFGFNFLENFEHPYISKTVSEFWQRWHISLGSWFRDYVYFPMGGSKVENKWRLTVNLFVVWLLTGIWHGANWTFIVWGVYYGVLITIEKTTSLKTIISKSHISRYVYQAFTILSVICGWVVFRSDSIKQGLHFIRTMFLPASTTSLIDSNTIYYGREYFLFFIFAILCSLPIVDLIRKRNNNEPLLIEYIIQILLFIFSISFIVMDYHNPFIYFNF